MLGSELPICQDGSVKPGHDDVCGHGLGPNQVFCCLPDRRREMGWWQSQSWFTMPLGMQRCHSMTQMCFIWLLSE